MKTLAQRFWPKVGKPNRTSGCWNWTGATINTGYGSICHDGKHCLAHRASWQIHKGEIPGKLLVLHRCDNRLCVNPAHLFLGTKKDNAIDMVKKGRNSNERLPKTNFPIHESYQISSPFGS